MTTLIVFGAKYLIYAIAVGALAATLWRPERRVRLFWTLVIALSLGYALARLVGLLYSHPQPFAAEGFTPLVPHTVDNAFPSDHTVIGGVFASVATLADWRTGALLWVLALVVGTSRVAAGLHYPVDIIAAVPLAIIAVWIAGVAVRYAFGAFSPK